MEKGGKKTGKRAGKKTGHRGLLIAGLCLAGMVVLGLTLFFTLRPKGTGGAAAVTGKSAETRLLAYLQQEQAEPRADTTGAALEAALIERANVSVDYTTQTTVNLTVTAPDMAALLAELRTSGGDGEALLAALRRGDYQEKVTRLTTAVDSDGRPEEAWAFLDAMYGGLLSYLNDLAAELGEVQE